VCQNCLEGDFQDQRAKYTLEQFKSNKNNANLWWAVVAGSTSVVADASDVDGNADAEANPSRRRRRVA
jgi:hypothetical protein